MKTLSLFFRAALLLILLIGTALTATAYGFVYGGIYYKITSSTNMTAAVTYYSKTDNTYSGTITIPEKVTHDGKTYYVTAIGEYAFVGCTGLRKVNYGSQRITTIGNYAFQGCNGMTSFVVPSHITSIGNYAFNGCYGMTGLVIEDSEETLSLGYAGSSAGLFCNIPLTSVFIGRPLSYSTYSSDGTSPFANNKTLTKVQFGNNVKGFQNCLFYGCTSLSTLVYNSQFKPTYVGTNCFNGCTSLTWSALNLPQTVTTINQYAFAGCTKFTSVVIKPNITSIGNYAFNGCSEMTGLVIEDSEETLSLGYSASNSGLFCNIPLTSVFIGRPLSYSTYSSDGISPFANNKTLTKARLGKKLTTIPKYLFYGCTYLEEVTSCAATPPTANANCFANYDATLYVPKGSVTSYKNAAVWKYFYSIVGIDIVDDVKPGDVDGDNRINIDDVTALINYLLTGNASSVNTTNADVDGDGRINIDDVTALINYLLTGHF